MSYHLCARQIGQCVGLGRGIKEYHLCARNANCKKIDREKVEKVVSKIKEREKNKQVERIGNFFYVAQSRPSNLKDMSSLISDYHSAMELANKPRIRKKTKEYWLEEARKAKEMVELKTPWMKKNFPNADINDLTLTSQLNQAMFKLEKNKKEIKERTYTRNRRTSSINTAIRRAVKSKGNKEEEEIKKVKDLMNEVIEKGSTKYMNNLIKNEKDPKKAQKKINKNQKTLFKLEEDAYTILFKLYDDIGKQKAREQIGTSLIYNFKQTAKN